MAGSVPVSTTPVTARIGSSVLAQVLHVLAPAAVVLHAVWSVLTLRGLIADGSWAFLRSLTAEGLWTVDAYRTFGGSLGQLLLAVSLALGVDDLGALAHIHTLSYVALPALCWVCSLWIVRHEPYWPIIVLAYVATALTSGLVAVADSNLLFALSTLAFVSITRYFTRGGAAWPWVALATSVVMIATHGLELLLGALLIASILLLQRRHGRRLDARWIAVIACQGLGMAVGALAIVRPYSPYNVMTASDLGTPMQNPQLRFLIGWLVLLAVAALVRTTWIRFAACALLVLALAWFVLDPSLWATPMQQQSSRTASGLLLFMLLAIALIMAMGATGTDDDPAPSKRTWMAVLSCGLLLAFLVPSAWHAREFRAYLGEFDAVIRGTAGQIDNEDFLRMVPTARTYGWAYAFPATSWVLGGRDPHAYVLSPPNMPWIDLIDPNDPPPVPTRFTGSVVGG